MAAAKRGSIVWQQSMAHLTCIHLAAACEAGGVTFAEGVLCPACDSTGNGLLHSLAIDVAQHLQGSFLHLLIALVLHAGCSPTWEPLKSLLAHALFIMLEGRYCEI